MTTHDQILETLRAQHPRSVEDLALRTLALRHHGANPRPLLATQLPNGAWPNALATAIPNVYATSLALIALAHTARHPAAHRAFNWLDHVKGREGHWLWRWKFHWFDRQVKFDPARYGWPWVEGTVSWVAPTALAVIAHRARRRLSPRIPRAAAMLLDRACPSGGWNAGNSEAYGVPLAAHPDFTAMGLLALRACGLHIHPTAARAAAYLNERLATTASAYSLAWANLVEYSPSACINTHPTLIAAAAEALYRLGAQTVLVGDGPGHVRDTALLLQESGLREALHSIGRTRFIDLNFDRVHAVPTQTALTTLNELWLPGSLLAADIVISMPKIKTHHWAGVTLSLKNLFGAVPGAVYGWPKNTLHWQGIDNSIVELAAAIPVHYVIADGVEAMEGNGPLHGPARHLGCLVFADDPLAADSACCSLMEINPYGIRHLAEAAPLGNLDPNQWDHLGEPIAALRQTFQPPPGMAFGRVGTAQTTCAPDRSSIRPR